MLALLLCNCAVARLPDDLRRAQAIETTNDLSAAVASYRAVWTSCESTHQRRPHDDCALAAVREAQLEERLERYAEAYATWRRAAALSESPRTTARALVRAAELAHEQLHDDKAALEIAWHAVEHFPDEVPTDDALALAVRLERDADPVALAKRLEVLWQRFAKQDLGDNLLYARAQLAEQRFKDWRVAVELYDLVAKTYRHTGLWDDSLWRAAQLLRAAGDAEGALRRLQQIIDARQDALITGSYNSLYLDDAQLLVGQIYLDDLHDPKLACMAFTALADNYPESVLRDDALAELARAELARNNRDAACAALARILRQFPDGNRARSAGLQRTELACRP